MTRRSHGTWHGGRVARRNAGIALLPEQERACYRLESIAGVSRGELRDAIADAVEGVWRGNLYDIAADAAFEVLVRRLAGESEDGL